MDTLKGAVSSMWSAIAPSNNNRRSKLSVCLLGNIETDYKGTMDTEPTDYLVHVAKLSDWDSVQGLYPTNNMKNFIKMRTTGDLFTYIQGKIFTPDRIRAFRYQFTTSKGEPLDGYEDNLQEGEYILVYVKYADYMGQIDFVDDHGFRMNGGFNKSLHAYATFPIIYSPSRAEFIAPTQEEVDEEYLRVSQQNGLNTSRRFT